MVNSSKMKKKTRAWILCSALIVLASFTVAPRADSVLDPSSAQNSANVYDVRAFGAKGDGQTLDTPAINKTIETAAAAGGGTVYFPAGTYLCLSIHLKSNIALYLDQGATILAADPKTMNYDLPEPNGWDMYQDF